MFKRVAPEVVVVLAACGGGGESVEDRRKSRPELSELDQTERALVDQGLLSKADITDFVTGLQPEMEKELSAACDKAKEGKTDRAALDVNDLIVNMEGFGDSVALAFAGDTAEMTKGLCPDQAEDIVDALRLIAIGN